MKFVKASLCLSIAIAITACSEQVSVETHLKNAKSYLNNNKASESIIELKNALRADSKNAEARFLLGKTYLNLGDGTAAVKELERAHNLNYPVNKVLPILARAYILTESDADVLALSDVATKLAGEERSHYLAYKTLAALRSQQIEQAKESAELAHTLVPKGLYSTLAFAYLELFEKNFDEVKALTLRILTIEPKQVDTLLLQGQVSMATKDYNQAAASFTKYLDLQPRSGIVQILLANALLKSEQFEEAEKYADRILSQIEDQPFAHYIKAMVAFNNKAFDQASEHAELALSTNFNPFDLKLVAGASAFYLNNWQQSHRHLMPLVKYLPKDHQARRMLAVAQLELGLVDEISSTIGDFEGEDTAGAKFLSSMSYKLLELGAMDEAKKVLAKDDSNSDSADYNARQGVLKLMMNDPTGIQNLEEAIALNPDHTEAELALAYASLQRNDINTARKIAIKWQTKYPKKAGGYNLMASIAIKEEKFDEAENLLAQSLSLEPDNLFALLEQLKLARQLKNEPLSRQRVDYLFALAPNNNKILRHYFGVYHNEMALDKIQAIYQKNNTDINLAILVAEAMVALEQYNEAEQFLTSLAGSDKLPKRYWQLMSFNYKKQNDIAKVELTLENWSKASPYHIEPIMLLADLHANRRDYNQGLNVVNRGLDYHKNNVELQLVKMQLLLNSNKIIEAKKLYKVLNDTNINDALKQGMLGRILLLEENYEEAIPKISRLYQTYPSSQNAAYLANAYLGVNNEAKAIDILEQYLANNKNDSRIKTMLAGIYIEGDSNKAITSYEDVVTKQPQNVIAHNNLAWLYLEQGKIEQALEHAKTAYELAPQIANIADTYGKVLLSSGDKRAALKYATKASELVKGKDIDIQLNYVNALIANSRSNEAKGLLTKISTETDEQAKLKTQLQSQL